MSEDNETETPSVHEANKVLRVLSNKRLKFTFRLHKPDGTVIEFQGDKALKLDWDSEARALFLRYGDYSGSPIMKWEDGYIVLTEENPTPA